MDHPHKLCSGCGYVFKGTHHHLRKAHHQVTFITPLDIIFESLVRNFRNTFTMFVRWKMVPWYCMSSIFVTTVDQDCWLRGWCKISQFSTYFRGVGAAFAGNSFQKLLSTSIVCAVAAPKQDSMICRSAQAHCNSSTNGRTRDSMERRKVVEK